MTLKRFLALNSIALAIFLLIELKSTTGRAAESVAWAPMNANTTPQTIPVCQTPLPTDTDTRVVFEAIEISGTPLTEFRPTCTAQFQPGNDATQPTYRWECGGPPDEHFFSLYLRGLTEIGKSVDLATGYSPPFLGYDFDSKNPNLAVFFRTPTQNRLSLELAGHAQAPQNFTVARAVITEHRLLGRRGTIGELRFVRGCAEFAFENRSGTNERGDGRPAGQLKVFFQGELEDLTLKPKVVPVAPTPRATPSGPPS